MAVAGLHNISAHNSSFGRESQSPVARRRVHLDRPRTRASSILQMWQEIEGEHVLSRPQVRLGERSRQEMDGELNADCTNTYFSGGGEHDNVASMVEANDVENACALSPEGSQNEHYDGNCSSSDQSINFGEVERERVRKICREWMNSGRASNTSHMRNCSRAQWLGEKERERVRVVREWVENTTHQRGTCHGIIEEEDAEIGSQIERVRDGLIVDQIEIGSRRTIRKLCGRQVLLDLLKKAERERKKEIQSLLEHHPVSDFPHRHRIQSLLKGRFLRNERFIQDERPTSIAARELGLLRQRHTVSDLREGFLSGVDNFSCGQRSSSQSEGSPNDGRIDHRDEQTEANNLKEVIQAEVCDHPDPFNEETDTSISYTDDSESDVAENINLHESAIQIDERYEVSEGEGREQLTSDTEFTDRRYNDREDEPRNIWGSDGYMAQETSGIEDGGQSASGHINQLEGNTVGEFNWQILPVQLEEWQESVANNDEIHWTIGNDDYTEWRDGSEQGIDVRPHNSFHQSYQAISNNDDREHSPLQDLHEEWHDNALIEATDSWSDEPSGQEVAPIGRIDVSYFSDDDNGYSLELRELLSRRRVSNLLRSGFRESLDRLIQSYVERQGQASVDWEMEETSPSPAIIDQDQELQSGDHITGESDVVGRSRPLALPSPGVTPSPNIWDQDFYESNWQQFNSRQHFGIDLEIINNLRIDMDRLHQRMDSMQSMLEASMDIQLELQRSMRQEISAALNRSSESEAREDILQQDESRWDNVKKGLCYICCDTNINSLLYRCGHMCTCSKCADKLVQGRDKCPICHAPVLEVIRAYFIQ